MAEQERTRANVLLSANCPNGDELVLVMFDDGACGISRNGEEQPAWHWNPCQMTEATKALLELAALSAHSHEL